MTGAVKAIGLVVFLFIAFMLFTVTGHKPVAAEGMRNCAPREAVLERLTGKCGESIRMMALGANGSVVEVMASGGGETWTILVTRPNGLTCLVASGTDFEVMESPSPPMGDKT